MRPYRGPILNVNDSLNAALVRADASIETFLFVQDGAGRWYGISKDELRRQAAQFPKEATLRSVLPRERMPHLHPDHDVEEALRRLSDYPLLPVVNRADFSKLEGAVGIPEILEAYHAAGTSVSPLQPA
jgi:CIC family chloride channel protein